MADKNGTGTGEGDNQNPEGGSNGKAGGEDLGGILKDIKEGINAGNQMSAQDREILAMLLDDRDGKSGGNNKNEPEDKLPDFTDMSGEDGYKAGMQYAEKVFSKKFKDLENSFDKKVQDLSAQLEKKSIKDEINGVRGSKFGKDFDEKLKDVTKVTDRYPQVSVLDALKIAMFDDLIKLRESKSSDSKNKQTPMPPGGISPDVLSRIKEGKGTIADTAKDLMAQLGL